MPSPVYAPETNPFDPGDDFPSTGAGVTLPDGVAGVYCDYPHHAKATFDNLVVTSWSGMEKRTAKVPRRLAFELRFEQLSPTDLNTLYNHFIAQQGRLYSFSYVDYASGEDFTVRYDMDEMDRETYLFEAEKTGIKLIEVL